MSRKQKHPTPDPVPPFRDTPLPGLDPRWSRTERVVSTAPCEPREDTERTWHLLDNLAVLQERGVRPAGTLLAVHGNPTWSYLWREVIAAATEAPAPWRVVAVDQLDMGFSERTGLTRRYEDRIRDLADLTAHLGLDDDRVVTLAHDWGGLISMGWAQEHPQAHIGTIMTNTAVHHDDSFGPLPAPLRLALASPVHSALTSRSSAFLDTALALCSDLPAEVRAAFKAPYRTAADRAGIEAFVADIPVAADHPSHARYESVASWVASSRVPALLLWGPKDPVFLERYLADLTRRLPQADVHRFEGANHLLPQDRALGAPIMDWLQQTFGQAPSRRERHGAERARAADGFTPFFAGLPLRATMEDAGTAVAIADMGPAKDDERPSVRAQLTWTELERRVAGIASGLLAQGVKPGDRINLMVPPGAELTALIYAALRVGAVIVVADTGLGSKGLTRALKGASPDWLVGIPRALTAAAALGWPGRRIAAGRLDPVRRRALQVQATVDELARTEPAPIPAVDPDADAAILFTSGSTGPAKGVVYTHRQMAAMRDAVGRVTALEPGQGLVAAFAPFALLAPSLGAASVTPDMDVTAPRTLTARALADAAAAIGATTVFASPAAIVNVLDTQEELSEHQRRALGEVKLMLSAGAPLAPELLERLQRLMPQATLRTPYGMTEALPLTDADLPGIRRALQEAAPRRAQDGTTAPGLEGAGQGVCVGSPLRGVNIQIDPMGPDGTPRGERTNQAGVFGEIMVRAPHAKDRYDRLWITEDASTRMPGWHATGDVGMLDARGRLWVSGRVQHVLTTADGPVPPVPAEQAAGSVPGVARAALVGVGEPGAQVPVVVVELQQPVRKAGLARPGLASRVRAAVSQATGLDAAAVLVVPQHPTDIRHNSKVDRSRLAAWAGRALSGGRIRQP